MLLGLSVFPMFEATCRLAGWGAKITPVDVFAEFDSSRKLFALSADKTEYRVADDRRAYFAEESFPANKSPGTFRIFVFGGSTVQGRPFSIPTSFGTFLKLGLQHAEPSRNWEVVNCGGVSYASYRLLPIVEECLNYQPDLFIVCAGHNEFLECVTYGEAMSASSGIRDARIWLNSLHSLRLLRHTLQTQSTAASGDGVPGRAMLPDEVDALLDHQGGLEAYTKASLHRGPIVEQFGLNLQQMVDLSKASDVRLMFMRPPSNLADCPPFKSEFSASSDTAVRKKIVEQLKAAQSLQRDDLSRSIRLLESTAELDPEFAFTWYQLGRSYLLSRRIEDAQSAFVQARDADVCPLRMTSSLAQTLQQVASRNRILHWNVHRFLEGQSRHGIVGDSTLVDHVHPSFRSNQKIAVELIERFAPLLGVSTSEDWKAAAEATFEAHLQSLNDMYYLRGRQTLENLKAWAAGRGDGPRLKLPHTSDDANAAH